MNKWYEENYVNRKDWILDHLELLGLKSEEVLIVLLIEFYNEHQIPITMELIQKKTGMPFEQVDRIVSLLCAKQYLNIAASAKAVRFDLSGLYDTNVARERSMMDTSLYEMVETVFGRTLNQLELQKISDWTQRYDNKLIMYALREASANNGLSLPYVEKILDTWQKKGITVDKIEERLV